MSAATISFAALAWLGLLFLAALVGEARTRHARLPGAWVYALALGVHCTSWTFFGTVTQAQRSGWWLPPTFVGMIALFAFGWPMLRRLVRLAHERNSTTLADFVAGRLGRSSSLAAVITGVMLLGTVPYLALQLKAVSTSFDLLVQRGDDIPLAGDSALWVAGAMAVFAMLFGTRRAAASDRHPGLLLAIACESVFKLVALLAIGIFVVFVLHEGPFELASTARTQLPAPSGGSDGFLTLILLGALAPFTLPHQFHVGVVECADPDDVRRARWRFITYLVLIALPILPLAWAGSLALGDSISSDLYVIGLPMAAGQPGIALLAFLGGLSAATAMVVMATLALSLMLGNHWLAPLLGRSWARGEGSGDLLGHVLWTRRIGIAVILLLAWAYSRVLFGSDALADIGAQSFSALGQLAPAVVVALYLPNWSSRAILVGTIAGVLVWAYVLMLPQVMLSQGMQPDWLVAGWLGFSWLSPGNLLGLGALEPLTRATLVGLAVNVTLLLALARGGRDEVALQGGVALHDLRRLASRFLDAQTVAGLFAGTGGGVADATRLHRVEHALSGVVGAASARLLLNALRRHDVGELETVAELVGETSQALQVNQQLLEAALANMSQGISVVDRDLRLVAWNRRYAELFDYPAELLRVGTPVAELVAWNAARGLAGDPADPTHVERRLRHMRAGTPYVTERVFPGGVVVEIRGNPMPGGGFVATFTDVTAFRRTESELKRVAETLEQRVAERTAESERARAEAERANRAKTRFLAAVSHDLAQPLHAAKLFNHALGQRVTDAGTRDAVGNIGGALESAEGLLAGLLDISRLDAGGLKPQHQPFALADLMAGLGSEFGVLAAQRGLQLDVVPTRLWSCSDPQMLRRILQNFLANAVRYTDSGRILFGCRRRGDGIDIEVWDTGPGIAIDDQPLVFEEFRRLQSQGQGLGLGLSIAERTARLLGHPLSLRSWPGRGTVFSLRVPRAAPVVRPEPPAAGEPLQRDGGCVLVVDNDASVLRAMESLLAGWNCRVIPARTREEALAAASTQRPDIVLLDFHLDDGVTGLAVLQALRETTGPVPAVIVTADHSEAVRSAVIAADCHLLQKPLKPLALRALMARLLSRH